MRYGHRSTLFSSTSWALVFVLAAVFAGCGKARQKNHKGPKVVTIDWNKKWSFVNDQGETGKFHIKQGFGKLHGATSDEGRREAYDDMIKGYKMIMDAIDKGDDLKAQVEAKEPGKSFPEWEEKLASWTEEASKVRKSSGMPMEYIDKLNE